MDRTEVLNGVCFRVRGRGPWLVFAHGVGMNKEVWEPQTAALSNDFTTVTYDLPGHGDSDPIEGSVTMDAYVDQVERLLDALNVERACFVGHSMGALVAIGLALRRPGRVRKLVALNAVYRRTPAQQEAALERARLLTEGRSAELVEQTLDRWFGRAIDGEKAALRVQFGAWLRQVSATAYADAYGVFARSDRLYEGRLKDLTMPSLFATGALDPNSTPTMSRSMAQEALRGQYVSIPGARHNMCVESPAAVNGMLADFLGNGAQADST